MSDALLISVRLHDGWYHGSDKSPSPARLFQAMVAGVGISGPLDEPTIAALQWLEKQNPPIIGSPHTATQRPYVNYVPNNESDAAGGYQERIKKAGKRIAPVVFDAEIPFLFAWDLADASAVQAAKAVVSLTHRIYQLGRTVDVAWAWADLLSADELAEHLNAYRGIVRNPSAGAGNVDCPTAGSLESLRRRYLAGGERFGIGASTEMTFRKRPRPVWKKVSYAGTPSRVTLELRRLNEEGYAPWPLQSAASLVQQLRDAALNKLRRALPERSLEIERVFIGRKANAENSGPTGARVRIIPLATIGHAQSDMQVRRVLVEVPNECPIEVEDIAWAVSGQQLIRPIMADTTDVVSSRDPGLFPFYGLDRPARTWQSVTPVALPAVPRRRIDPHRAKNDDSEKKNASEKCAEHLRASFALAQAVRHANITARFNSVRFQREPFDRRGVRAEPFAEGTRFSKHCLWHVELEFETPVPGPLLLGDGRFVGLGLMRPIRSIGGVYAFSIKSGLASNPDPRRLTTSLRRAIMARTRDVLGSPKLPPYFSGHRDEGSPVRLEEPHLAYLFDDQEQQLLVVTPGRLQRKELRQDAEHSATLAQALEGLGQLRAGRDGCLELEPACVDDASHRLFQMSTVWESQTPYDVNRHARNSTADRVLENDVLAACKAIGLPRPQVSVLKWHSVPKRGLQGWLRLQFKDAIPGLLMLGRSRFLGGGLFAPVQEYVSPARM